MENTLSIQDSDFKISTVDIPIESKFLNQPQNLVNLESPDHFQSKNSHDNKFLGQNFLNKFINHKENQRKEKISRSRGRNPDSIIDKLVLETFDRVPPQNSGNLPCDGDSKGNSQV